ncbi:MAG: GLPGLI family protein [Sphingobacteriaceae bacterium]|nr:GLPGLI family protein [Sphingobacteriaceae bacterium]
MIFRISLSILILLCSLAPAQITRGKITFERRTNLYKKFKGDDYKRWIKEEDKIKIDFFELYFNDTISVFKPQESELKENFEWATQKNTVYQNFNTQTRYLRKFFWGEELNLTDSLFTRNWKITESTRMIAGYACRKALWQVNDTTRIYAWFSYDLIPGTGPESFYGLPGTILGLATEDGGIIYFAKKVELIEPPVTVFIPSKRKKVYTVPEMKEEMIKRWGKEKWFKGVIHETFEVW